MHKIMEFLEKIINSVVKQSESIIVLESNPPLQDNTGALFNSMLKYRVNDRNKIIWLIYNYEGTLPKYRNVKYIYLYDNSLLNRFKTNILETYWIKKSFIYIFSHRKNYDFEVNNKRIVNLTHGVPIKDCRDEQMPHYNVNNVISTSNYSSELIAYTFDIELDEILVTGYPRNDLLFNQEHSEEKYIVWLPTYRKHQNNLNVGEFDVFPLSPTMDELLTLDNKLRKINYKLYIKPHPAQKLDINIEDFTNIENLSNEFFTSNNIHLYDFIGKSEILITDYSSVYVDYLLLDKPIIFTFDDLEEYTKSWGFTVQDIHEVTPGEKVTTMNELTTVIEEISLGKDNFSHSRQETGRKFHKFLDNKSSERLLKELELID